MDQDWLREYLATRRLGWPYGDVYRVENAGAHRFVAWIGDELAGLSWAEVAETGTGATGSDSAGTEPSTATGVVTEPNTSTEARMHMNLKPQFAEFGIGTELLALLMEDLRRAGCDVIHYEIDRRYWSFQIYRNLGFEVEDGGADEIGDGSVFHLAARR